jgi:hypothetical protein
LTDPSNPFQPPEPSRGALSPPDDRRQALVAAVVTSGVFVGALQALYLGHLQQTAMLFVGLPTLIATLVAMMQPRSILARAMQLTTLALLMSATVLHEAFVCVLMASPLFYGFAAFVGAILSRQQDGGPRARILAPWALIAAMALEGTTPALSWPAWQEVTVERVVAAAPDEVAAALAATPRFSGALPAFLRLGFPVPGAAAGAGLRVGDVREIPMYGGDHDGVMRFRVSSSEPGRAVFTLDGDTSKVMWWLRWDRSEVRWAPTEGGTKVAWTVSFRRDLHPAWYFAPLERYAVGLAAGVLIDEVATP